ncbi:WD40-repeat-containing domain protein [Mycena floridula]|nr:WD40-repeat-containing domain protein [Mycena floridula]
MAISSTDDRFEGLLRTGEVLSCRFDSSGQNIADCSADRSVSFWRVYPLNTNHGSLSNMTKALILDFQSSLYSPMLYTVGTDHNLCIIDVTTSQRIRRICAHREIMNSLDRTMAGVLASVTASDDKTVQHPAATFELKCPAIPVCFNADGANVYIGALGNEIHFTRSMRFCHTNTPTSLSLSPNGHFLSPSLSSQTLIHDVRLFSSSPTRVHRSLQGAPTGFENTLLREVTVGGADRMVCIWDVESGRLLYKLPGHKGAVTAVDFHPKEPIILTGSKDGIMLLGEIHPIAFSLNLKSLTLGIELPTAVVRIRLPRPYYRASDSGKISHLGHVV